MAERRDNHYKMRFYVVLEGMKEKNTPENLWEDREEWRLRTWKNMKKVTMMRLMH